MPSPTAETPPAARPLLAIDTSADRAGLALFDGSALTELTWPAARLQTIQVPRRIAELLADAGVTPAELGGVAVAIGPGTFTGLRVGLSLAKGFALAGNLPIVGVRTLEATAWPWAGAGRAVIAALPAGRGRLVWQRFGRDGAEIDGPVNGTPADLLDAIENESAEIDAIVGELPADLREALAAAPVPVIAEPGLASRIGAVAQLGWRRLSAGDVDDLATLEPIYVHGTPKATRPVRDPQHRP
jgi:tRNA threonylcarbamoyladenosine biosynthesis protein TsaB